MEGTQPLTQLFLRQRVASFWTVFKNLQHVAAKECCVKSCVRSMLHGAAFNATMLRRPLR